jgi:hypothetical protein
LRKMLQSPGCTRGHGETPGPNDMSVPSRREVDASTGPGARADWRAVVTWLLQSLCRGHNGAQIVRSVIIAFATSSVRDNDTVPFRVQARTRFFFFGAKEKWTTCAHQK